MGGSEQYRSEVGSKDKELKMGIREQDKREPETRFKDVRIQFDFC